MRQSSAKFVGPRHCDAAPGGTGSTNPAHGNHGLAAPARPFHAPRLGAREEALKASMLKGLAGNAREHLELLRTIRPLLATFFGRRLGSEPGEVEDLVQEVLLAMHERRASYDRSRPFTPWLFAIARYKLIDHYRRFPRRHEPIDRLEDILAAEGFQSSCEARLDVAALLRTLPEKQARAIRDTRLREMTAADAARAAGVGESAVKVSAHRGIRTLMARVAAMPA